MINHIMVLPDGTQISSGATLDPALMQVKLTQKVNTETELTFGTVFATMLEVNIWATEGCPVQSGDMVTLYREYAKGGRSKVGCFILEKPTCIGGYVYKIIAYDAVCKLDQDLTKFLSGLQGWPYTFLEFGKMICQACGLTFKNESQLGSMLNSDFLAQKFTARDVTGRQLMKWLAEAAGCFCRADADGLIELAWYENTDLQISSAGEDFYYAGSLSFEDYSVAAIDKVLIRWGTDDVGTGFGKVDGQNVYIVESNPLLVAQNSTTLAPVAKTMYMRLASVAYTPCKVSVPAETVVKAGQILSLYTPRSGVITVYVMECVTQGGKHMVTCTGGPDRNSALPESGSSYKSLSGKVLRLQTDVDGIRLENEDTTGKYIKLQASVDGLDSEVAQKAKDIDGIKESVSTIKQTADSVQITVKTIQEDGVLKVKTQKNYTFDDDGLKISGDGSMENLLDETGMYVRRSGQILLQVTHEGVDAADVTVRNYLIVGKNSRFEDYTNGTDSKRTACFSLEG